MGIDTASARVDTRRNGLPEKRLWRAPTAQAILSPAMAAVQASASGARALLKFLVTLASASISHDARADPSPWHFYQEVSQRTGEGAPGDNFGLNVALGENLAAISALDASSGTGRLHVYNRSGAVWSEQPTTLAPAGLTEGARLGSSLSVSGAVVAAGAPSDGETGAAYLFEAGTSGWRQWQLSNAGATVGASFGHAIAVDRDTVVVGAPDADLLDIGAGAAFVFVRNGSDWKQQGGPLLAADGPGQGAHAYHQLGTSVALQGDTIVVSASGEPAAYVFERTDGKWYRSARITQSDPQAYDEFGIDVSVYGNVIAVGADLHDDVEQGADAGIVYVYRRNNGSWPDVESERLNGAAGWFEGAFGYSVSLGPGGMVVGASAGDPGNTVYFLRDTGRFTRFDAVAPADLKLGDVFGRDVVMGGQGVLVGVPNWYGGLGSARFFGLPLGNYCTSAVDCKEGFCSDNVCCDAACSSACETCLAKHKDEGPDGECGHVTAGKDPRGACAPESCTDERSERPAAACGERGECVEPASRSCGGYACVGDRCLTVCKRTADCDDSRGFTCAGGRCSIPLGGACVSSDSCVKGSYCVDGVCCNEPCDGTCESCLAAQKGAGRDGICAPIPDGSDPERECERDEDNKCGATGDCDGARSCKRFAPSSVSCGETTCVDEVSRGRHCSGEGDCVDRDVECWPFACEAGSCAYECEDDGACAPGTFCGAKKCMKVRPDNEDCGLDHECESGHCAGGVCASEDRCSEDGFTRIPLQGKAQPCAPFACRAGSCLKVCAESSECATDFDCNPTTRECEQVQARRSSASCRYDARFHRSDGTLSGLVFVVPLLLRARRRRASSIRVRINEQRKTDESDD